MPDRHITYEEVSEYGRPCVTSIMTLVGTSDLVDFDKLAQLLSKTIDAVEAEWTTARHKQSDLRSERSDTTDANAALRDVVSRFYYHLMSQPNTVDFDFDAFYEGRNLGELSRLKPADLAAKAADVLRGFDAGKNKAVASFASWKTDITAAYQTLDSALGNKGHAAGDKFVATAALIQARKDFLHTYNRVTKPIVRGVLALLGRENEYPLFFKDLAVQEGGSADKAPTDDRALEEAAEPSNG